jgi:hypothetical protein
MRSSGTLPSELMVFIGERDCIAADLMPKDRWDKIAIMPTALVFRPIAPSARMRPAYRAITHSLAHLEQIYPFHTFVAGITELDFQLRCRAAEAEWDRLDAEIKLRITAAAQLDAEFVPWQAVPANWQDRIRKSKITGCWRWHCKEAPYRQLYCRLKGDVPEGAVLRHTCDNRRCVNPNHLLLGTIADNNQDRQLQRRSTDLSPLRERR